MFFEGAVINRERVAMARVRYVYLLEPIEMAR